MADSALAGTKLAMLGELMTSELSIADLAARLEMTGAAVRQHMQSLEAAGLVEKRKLGGQPNRPTHLFRLSDAGKAVFPRRHALLLSLLIDTLAEREGEGRIAELLRTAAARLARLAPQAAGGEAGDARWTALLAWLEQELGWHAQAEAVAGGERRITIHQCPFQAVSNSHPGVCGEFLTALLAELQPGHRVEHLTDCGVPACCALRVMPDGAVGESAGRATPTDGGG